MLAGIALITASLLSGCQTNGQAISAIGDFINAATLDDAQMAQMSLTGVQSLDSAQRIAPANSKHGKRLAKLSKAYKEVNGRPLNFKVYETKEVNAFATPDGSIRIHGGLMDLMTDDEVLFVIGHEIGHVYHGHSKKRFQVAYATSGLAKLATSQTGLGGLSAGPAAALLSEVTKAQFSQENEREADDYGYQIAVEAGASPNAPASALRKLAALGGSGNNFVQQMLSTHPDPASRAERMEARAQQS